MVMVGGWWLVVDSSDGGGPARMSPVSGNVDSIAGNVSLKRPISAPLTHKKKKKTTKKTSTLEF